MKTWDELTLPEQAAMMKVAVKNGIYDLPTIRQKYNEFAEGGSKEEEEVNTIVPFTQRTEVIVTPDAEYNQYLNTLPDNQRFTPNDRYDSYLYWKLNGRPRNFEETYNRDMFHYDHSDNAYHANSIAFGPDGVGYFMKPKDHDTVGYELDWFNKGIVTEEGGYQRPETPEEKAESDIFRRDYRLMTDPNRPNFYKYQPINKHSIGGPLVEAAMNEYANGGGIHIKHPGRLTALKKRTGKTEAELYRTGSPATRKMITFARNARKWKHGLGGNLFDDTTQPSQKMQIGLDVQGWPNYTTEQLVAYGEENERRRKAIQDAYLNFVIESNDATAVANGRPQNQHLVDRAVRGAKANAAWEKEHPNLTTWSYLPSAAVIGTALAPLGAAGWSGLTALGDAAAATSVGQGITNFLTPIATTSYAGATVPQWFDLGLTSGFGAHGIQTAINEGGISPTTALELLPVTRVVKPAVEMGYNAAKPVIDKTVTTLQNNYPALFDPYTSWDATLGYHGDNIFSRAIGTVGRRYGYTPKAEVPEFHRRLTINRPSQLKLDEEGNMIISSGRTGEGHDGIVNFATSEPARGHSSHKSLSGIDDYIIDSKAIGNQDFKSIQPSDTFFETGQLAIDPKSMTLVSGNTEMLDYARSLGMRTLSSPRLRQLTASRMTKEDVINSRSEGIAKFLQNVGEIKYGKGQQNAGQIGEEMQRLTSMRGTPTMQDYSYFEGLTGLNSGVRPAEMWNGTKEQGLELFGNWGKPRRTPTFNHVSYAPASNIESIYREAKMGIRPWEDYYAALENMPSARQQLGLNSAMDTYPVPQITAENAATIQRQMGNTTIPGTNESTVKAAESGRNTLLDWIRSPFYRARLSDEPLYRVADDVVADAEQMLESTPIRLKDRMQLSNDGAVNGITTTRPAVEEKILPDGTKVMNLNTGLDVDIAADLGENADKTTLHELLHYMTANSKGTPYSKAGERIINKGWMEPTETHFDAINIIHKNRSKGWQDYILDQNDVLLPKYDGVVKMVMEKPKEAKAILIKTGRTPADADAAIQSLRNRYSEWYDIQEQRAYLQELFLSKIKPNLKNPNDAAEIEAFMSEHPEILDGSPAYKYIQEVRPGTLKQYTKYFASALSTLPFINKTTKE